MLNRGPLTRDHDLRFAHTLSQNEFLPPQPQTFGHLLRKVEFEEVKVANVAVPLWGQDSPSAEAPHSERATKQMEAVSLKVATTFLKVWAEIRGDPSQTEPFDEYIVRVRKEWQEYKTAAMYSMFYARKPAS